MKKRKSLPTRSIKKNPLQISNIVYGREKVGTRVALPRESEGKGIEKKK